MAREFNANRFSVTRGIIAHAMNMADLLPRPLDFKPRAWGWKMHEMQRVMLLYNGVAHLELFPNVEGVSIAPRRSHWTLFDILLEVDLAMTTDEIQLWHGNEHVLSITNLALPPSFVKGNTSNAETKLVR